MKARICFLVAAAALLVGCDALAPSATPTDGAATFTATAAAPNSSATPEETAAALPDGLEPRPRMPALVNGELDPCLPLCRTDLTRPGLVAVAQRYQTQWFAGGYLTLTFPEPWSIGEDSTGELGIALPEEEAATPPGEVPYHVGIALDVWPAKDGKRVAGVPSTASAIEAWFRGDENYRVLRAVDTRIGILPARAIDVGLSEQAPEQYPECGAPCVDGLTFEQWDDLGGIRGKDVYRYYLADISYGGENHLLSVEVQARNLEHVDALVPRVAAVLDTLRIRAHAAPIEASGRIVFARYSKADDFDEAVTINADGTGERLLVPGGHECPRWSNDGKTIAMTGETAPLFISVDNGHGFQAGSPDGKLILGCGAFSSNGKRYATESWDDIDPGRNGIYVFDSNDGRRLRRLTSATGGESDLPGDWSPDDRWIAYTRGGDLMIVRTDGSEEPRLVAAGDFGTPAWSADGRTLLASSGGQLYLVVIDERRGPQLLGSDSPDVNGTAFDPRWSPDNQWIVFSMNQPGPRADLWRMRLDGTQLTRVTNHPDVDCILGDWVR